MNLRLKTKIEEEEKLNDLQSWLHLSSKASVMRLAIVASLKMKNDPRLIDNELQKYDVKNQSGVDYLRLTIFGQEELFFKLLMINHLGRNFDDDEFFPELTSYHISRGLKFLHSEYRYLNDKNKFINMLLNLDK